MSGPSSLRILVVGPAWIGDMVMAQTLFRVLRDRHPDSRIDVLAPAWSREVVERMPEVDEVIPLPLGHGELRAGVRWRLARELRRTGYDQAIVTKNSLKSALVPWLARIPRRTGYLGEWRFGLLNDIRSSDADDGLTARRYALLGVEPGQGLDPAALRGPRLRVDPKRQARRAGELGLEPREGMVGLAPGAAYGPSKRWPEERWCELAAKLGARGRRSWVFGGEDERAAGRVIEAAGGGSVTSLAGRTSLTDVVDLMAMCDTVVTNDSGLMHVASGLDVRVVALFGSSSPRRTPPFTPRATIFWLDLSCSPCFERSCPLGHHGCLRRIGVEEVLDAVLKTDEASRELATGRDAAPAIWRVGAPAGDA